MQPDLGRFESSAVFSLQNFVIRLVVIGEFEIRAIPTQFLAWITRRLHRQQSRLGDAPADLERRPQMLLLTMAIIDPILPMIMARDLRQRLVVDRFAFAENRQSP